LPVATLKRPLQPPPPPLPQPGSPSKAPLVASTYFNADEDDDDDDNKNADENRAIGAQRTASAVVPTIPANRNGGLGLSTSAGFKPASSLSNPSRNLAVRSTNSMAVTPEVNGKSEVKTEAKAPFAPLRAGSAVHAPLVSAPSSSYLRADSDDEDNNNDDYSPAAQAQSPMVYRPLPAVLSSQTGLHNLGNTCFMNSALQCLVHSFHLSRFFLSGEYRKDMNPTNPLGTRCRLVQSYAKLLQDM